MTFEQFMNLFMAAVPSLTAIIGVVFAVIKGIRNNKVTADDLAKKFEDVKAAVEDSKELTELKEQLKIVYQENFELKKDIKQLVQKIDKLYSKEE